MSSLHLTRRLKRLEGRLMPTNDAPIIRIDFVSTQREVVGSLVLGPDGHKEWLRPGQVHSEEEEGARTE
jgi:hypothetical protein